MELYGGGMVGKSNNYQLGGRIARSKRGREFQAEIADLKRKAERDAENKSFRSKIGSVGKFFGNLIVPGAGDVIDTVIQSGYKPKDYSGGKYAQGIRDDLTQQSEDYKSSVFERGLVGGLQTALMPEVYSGIKEELGKGVDWLKGLKKAKASEVATQAADIAGATPDFAAGFGTAPVHQGGMAASGFKLSAPPQLGNPMQGVMGSLEAPAFQPEFGTNQGLLGFFDPYEDFSGTLLDGMYDIGVTAQRRPLGRKGGMIPKYPHGGPVHTNMSAEALANMNQQNALQAAQQTSTVTDYTGTAQSPISTQTTPTIGGIDTEALSGLSASGFNMGNFLGGSVLGDGSGVDLGIGTGMGFTPGTGTGTGTGTAGATGGASVTDPSGTYGGYGTAIDPIAALGQMGMGNIASDPRLQKYLKDLPQFSMGYQQQFGDIQSGGRQALSQMYAAQRNMGGRFAGAGAGAQAFGQQYSGLLGEQARKRRGVVEGFQSDLLSGIRDIEEKGDFVFGQGAGGMTQVEMRIQDLIDQGYTADEAERQISQDTAAGETYG